MDSVNNYSNTIRGSCEFSAVYKRPDLFTDILHCIALHCNFLSDCYSTTTDYKADESVYPVELIGVCMDSL